MKKVKRHTITAALPYANGPLHLGHVAGVYVPADIYARYLRAKGEDVAFICGSDEHGAAITLRAKKEGIGPQEIVDKYHEINCKAFEDLGIQFDIYHRTSSQEHHKTATEYFSDLDQKGVFTKESSEQYFDEEHQQFLADRYITGECPKCQHPSAYGDQCENCGSALSPSELIKPTSTLSGKTPILKETSHWYLPMDQYEEWVREWISKGTSEGKAHHDPSKWRKHVLGQCMSWIDGGLRPRAMTRDLDWGVKVPVEGGEGKVLYVWLDAPIGYISATKAWAKEQGKDWEPYWKSDDTELVHFLGKDNIVFHCIIFPILLKAHGEYILPKNVLANEFLNLEGDKFSTSRNYAVWLHDYLIDFPDQQDVLRYVLCSIAPETKDSEFTWKDFQTRNNSELVAILGNFVNRTLVLTNKYYNGIIPEPGVLGEDEKQLGREMADTVSRMTAYLDSFRFRDALSEMMKLARAGNKYLADSEPWKLVKTDPERVKTILYQSLQIVANLSLAMEPFLPFTAQKLSKLIAFKSGSWEDLGSLGLIKPGHQIEKPELLFSKIEDDTIEAQIAKLKAPQNSKHKAMKPEITFDEFTKLDIRVGTILEAKKHENADKLLVLKVDTGLDQRTIVSGISAHYQAEDIVGKKVSVLLNLAPRKIRGIESQGMILMAEDLDEGALAFVSPEKDIENGGEVR